jgi:ADP-ribosyl-[dinitrogen reductase] hydrolase
MITKQDRLKGCLVGLAVGDAVGTTLEFVPRDDIGVGGIPKATDMVGGGPFNLKAGQWTDDTSMALCLAESLILCGSFNVHDQMDRYRMWMSEGHLSSTGVLFDIGHATARALSLYGENGNPYAGSLDEMSSGNGSIMRLAPVPIFYHDDERESVVKGSESSMTTHGSRSCQDSCALMSLILNKLINGANKEDIFNLKKEVEGYLNSPPGLHAPSLFLKRDVAIIDRGDFLEKSIDDIKGSGYVIESLEAALWCFHKTDNYKDAILTAVNLGDDADTTAAVCGQFAGAYYGLSGIPKEWVENITLSDEIIEMAEKLSLS